MFFLFFCAFMCVKRVLLSGKHKSYDESRFCSYPNFHEGKSKNLFLLAKRKTKVMSNTDLVWYACVPATFMASSKSLSYNLSRPITLVLRPISFASDIMCSHSSSDRKWGISAWKKKGEIFVKIYRVLRQILTEVARLVYDLFFTLQWKLHVKVGRLSLSKQIFHQFHIPWLKRNMQRFLA